jgi:hypothetical protein
VFWHHPLPLRAFHAEITTPRTIIKKALKINLRAGFPHLLHAGPVFLQLRTPDARHAETAGKDRAVAVLLCLLLADVAVVAVVAAAAAKGP